MTTIISQDKKTIVNAEAVSRIFTDGQAVYAVTAEYDTNILLGKFSTPQNIDKVMTYLGFNMAANNKAIIIPSDATVSNDKQIAADFIAKTLREVSIKKTQDGGVTAVEIDPEFKKIIEQMLGGNNENKGGSK